jgi:hypothetical protein
MTATATAPAWSKFLDVYDWRARALPAMLCLLPALAVLVIAHPSSANWQQSGMTLLVSCGFFFVLTRIARDAGRRIQDDLFKAWSGAPTTQLLRHRNEHYDVHTKQALHAQLANLTGLTLPSAREEQEQPVAADEVYRAAALWLIKRTRDTQRFPLLFKENIHFGFQRNALGLRWFGAVTALASTLWILLDGGVLSWHAPYYVADHWHSLTEPMAVSLMFSLLMVVLWLFGITAAAAKRTGFAYAERLIECADALTADSPPC